jgi:hypothetical protein
LAAAALQNANLAPSTPDTEIAGVDLTPPAPAIVPDDNDSQDNIKNQDNDSEVEFVGESMGVENDDDDVIVVDTDAEEQEDTDPAGVQAQELDQEEEIHPEDDDDANSDQQEQGGHKRFLRLASIFKNFCCQSLNFLSYLPYITTYISEFLEIIRKNVLSLW